jgi:putative ABC transport system permease protein
MRWTRSIIERARALLERERMDADMAEELRFHLDQETGKNLRAGMRPEEARRKALIAFGGLDRFSEETRRERGILPLENLAFTLVAILTLALGIGATTVVFSVFNTVVLRPLPFEEAQRLVRIRELTPRGDPMSVSDPNFLDFKAQNRSLQEMVAVYTRQLILTEGGEPIQISGMAATEGLFRMIGVSPVLGRDFLPEDFRPGEEPEVVILGEGLWTRQFGADPEMVGRSVILDGVPRVVVGVLPALERPFRFDAWLPWVANPTLARADHRREVFARLAPEVSVQQAVDDLNRIQESLGVAFPQSNAGYGVWMRTLPEWLIGPQVTRIAQVLLGAVGLLLLLACVSVSNLLIARGTTRHREISLRAALGAGRSRLLSQLLVESLVLAGIGAGIGVLLAYWALPVIQALDSTPLPRLEQVGLDGTVLSFTVAATLLSTLVFGVAPALQGSRADLMELLRTGGMMAGGRTRRLRDGLVASQMAIATVLLVGAGLLAGSFVRMVTVDPGFDADGVLLIPLSLPGDRYPEMSPQVAEGYREILRAVEAVPGVTAAGVTMASPITGNRPANFVARADQSGEQEDFLPIRFRPVTPGFFAAMGLPVHAGVPFNELEVDALISAALAGEQVAVPIVVSQDLADRLFPDGRVVGETVIWNQPGGTPMSIEAVVGDALDLSFPGDAGPTAYLPHGFVPWPAMTLVLRVAGDPALATPLIREAVWSFDPSLPVPQATLMEDALRGAISAPRLNMLLMAIFALSALLLASVALYGITAFAVARRTREIGVRLAMGAPKSQVMGMVLKRGLALVILGAGAGLVGAVLLSRFLESLLFEIGPTDAATYGAVSLILGSITLLAAWFPARRALRVDPTIALQAE